MEQPVVQDSSLAQVRETISTNVKGTVKWFHRVKGFGFITREDTNEDVFVHFTSIKPMSINLRKLNKKRLNLMDKEKVQFDVVKTQTGIEAVNVVGKNGYLILDIIALKRDIPPFDLEIINEARVTGKVKWFNVKIKYGFVHCDYNNEDVFVHSSAIIKNNPNKYKPSLNEGEPVEFDILKRADGKLEAVNVSGPQGTNVQGSRYSPDKINEGDETNKNYVEKDLVGKVKWFNVKAGFGFISRNDNGQDVYAHYSAISKKNPNHRVRSLADGEIVHFNIVQGSKGAEATDITGPSDLPVQGSQYARTVDSETRGSVRSTSRQQQQQRPRRRMQPRNSFNNSNSQNRISRVNNFSGPRPNRRQNNQNGPMNPNGYSQANRGSVNPYVGNQYVDQGNNYPNQNRPRRGNYQSQPVYPPNTIPPYQPPMRIQQQQFPSYNNGNRYMNGNEAYVGQDFNIQNGYYNQRMTQNQFDQNQLPPNMRFVDRRVPGVSKWYNFKNGFGFVTRTDTNQDIFVHKSGIQGANKSIPSLDDGEPVEFDVVEDGTRLLAINVTGPNGSLLRGSKYAPISNMRQSRPRTETQGFNSAQGQRTKVYQKRKFN